MTERTRAILGLLVLVCALHVSSQPAQPKTPSAPAPNPDSTMKAQTPPITSLVSKSAAAPVTTSSSAVAPQKPVPAAQSAAAKPDSGAIISAPAVKPDSQPKGTIIPAGVISGQWVRAESPYRIQGSVIVPAGQSLQIDSGVVVLMEGPYLTVTVFGQILARGTREHPVVFKSGQPDPKPWDWDRLLFRSKTRSFLQNCVIQHSNFGVYAVNSGLTLMDCKFSRNSIHGLFAENSSVSLQGCTFEKGHVCAILLSENASLEAERDTIQENINGIACSDFSKLDMRNSYFTGNDIGIALRKNAAVNLIDTRITDNKTGVLSETAPPKKALKNIFNN